MEQIYRKIKMLASTIQFSHNTTRNHTNHNNRSRQATSAQKENKPPTPHTRPTSRAHKAVDGVFPDTRQRTDIPLNTSC